MTSLDVDLRQMGATPEEAAAVLSAVQELGDDGIELSWKDAWRTEMRGMGGKWVGKGGAAAHPSIPRADTGGLRLRPGHHVAKPNAINRRALTSGGTSGGLGYGPVNRDTKKAIRKAILQTRDQAKMANKMNAEMRRSSKQLHDVINSEQDNQDKSDAAHAILGHVGILAGGAVLGIVAAKTGTFDISALIGPGHDFLVNTVLPAVTGLIAPIVQEFYDWMHIQHTRSGGPWHLNRSGGNQELATPAPSVRQTAVDIMHAVLVNAGMTEADAANYAPEFIDGAIAERGD